MLIPIGNLGHSILATLEMPAFEPRRRIAACAAVSLFLLAISVLTSGAAGAASLSLRPAVDHVAPHESIVLTLRIEGLGAGSAPALGGFDIDLGYDASIFELESIQYGDVGLGDQLELGGFSAIQIDSVGGGTISLVELSLSPTAILEAGQPSAFDLVQLQFRAIGLGTGDFEIDPASLLANAAGGAIPIDRIENARITSAVPEPSAALLFGVGLWLASRRLRRRTP